MIPTSYQDKDDLEADKQFEKIEAYIEGRKSTQNKREEKQQTKKVTKIQQNLDMVDFKKDFGALKEKISDVSRDQWEALPDAPDLVKISRKRRNQEYQRYTPVPDSILSEASQSAAANNYSTTVTGESDLT